MPMNQEIKKAWTNALRSGAYRQGRLHLQTNEAFCCLGVLCDLATKAGIVGRETLRLGSSTKKISFYNPSNSTDASDTHLPGCVAEWAEIEGRHKEEDVRTPVLASGVYLVDLNDKGMSFSEIAALLEEDLEF